MATFDQVAYKQALVQCKAKIREFIEKMNCHPIMVRLAWHDSGTYDKNAKTGGANASIRFEEELAHGANAGLDKAMRYVESFKKSFPILSYADIIQMCSAEAIELGGGPHINMRYGRLDAEAAAKDGNLPDAMPPFKGEKDAASHLRNVFHRMGFSDKDIVTLSGAHTFGRAFKERSGTTDKGYGSKGTRYTSGENHVARKDSNPEKGMLGGISWTSNWLAFDNSYFRITNDADCIRLPTDKALETDPKFKPYFEKYAASQDAFFEDYADVHRRLSELGSKFVVPGGVAISFDVEAYRKALQSCRAEMRAFMDKLNCQPIMVRLAWHDSGTFDVNNEQNWPACGGANGSIRFQEELAHGANAGLSKAVNYIASFKEKYPIISWADLMQLASAEAIEQIGGPKINMRYGRIDASECPKEGNLPEAMPPYKGEKDASTHLRNVFYRMGFDDRAIVCLSGAHTIGRAFKERSGTVEEGYGSKGTDYTSNESYVARGDGSSAKGMLGGKSWTNKWLVFDNSYFTLPRPSDKLLWLPTDKALQEDESFSAYFELYRKSQDAFFEDYAETHKALSELGSKFVIPGGIVLPQDSKL